MSIAPSLPSAEQLRELTGRDFSADIFELPRPEDSGEKPERSRSKWSIVMGLALAALAGGIAYAIYSTPAVSEAPVTEPAPLKPAVSKPAPSDASAPVIASPEAVAPAPRDASANATASEAGLAAFESRFDSLSSAGAVVVATSPSAVSAVEPASVRAKPASVSVEPAPVRVEPAGESSPANTVTSVVALDVQELEARTLGSVRQMLFRGDRRSAKSALLDFMREYGERAEPKTVLAGLLLQEGNLSRASALLSDVDAITPSPQLRVLKARVLAAQRRPADAVALLEAFPPPIDVMADYHALLALLYQQLSQFGKSADLYASLTAFDPSRASWQLGYAISLEGEGRTAIARDIYSDLLADGRLNRDLAEFAYARLRNLSYRQ